MDRLSCYICFSQVSIHMRLTIILAPILEYPFRFLLRLSFQIHVTIANWKKHIKYLIQKELISEKIKLNNNF